MKFSNKQKRLLSKIVPVKSWRALLKEGDRKLIRLLIEKHLYGLNGIEIGASRRDFGLRTQKGSYANVDIIDAETRAKEKGWSESRLVNILSPGDDLPFKDEVFDYVFNSHVLEHIFDPIKAVEEWLRVVKKGGIIFMVIPHKERTFDKNRDLSPYQELIERNDQKISFTDYVQRTKDNKLKFESETDQDHHILIKNGEVPDGWIRYKTYDYRHHWTVWDTRSFLELCEKRNWNVLEYQDVAGYDLHEFTIIISK